MYVNEMEYINDTTEYASAVIVKAFLFNSISSRGGLRLQQVDNRIRYVWYLLQRARGKDGLAPSL